jgi:carboxyl-terminal processing protease
MENFKVDRVDFKHGLRASDFPVTDRWIDAFRSFLARSSELNLTASQLDSELEFTKLRLRYEMVTAAFGGDAGQRVLTESDPQVMRAIEVLPDARKLAELAKQSDPMG